MPRKSHSDVKFQHDSKTRNEKLNGLILKDNGIFSKFALPIFFLIFSGLVVTSWFIKYPDVVSGKVKIMATNGPKEIMTIGEGKLVKLLVAHHEKVVQNQELGFLESGADYSQVKALYGQVQKAIDWLNENQNEKAIIELRGVYRDLGDIQQEYQQFSAAYQQFTDYVENGFYQTKRYALLNDIELINRDSLNLVEQQTLLQEDLGLQEEAYRSNKMLLEEKVISRQDDRTEKSKLIGKQLSIPQIKASLISIETRKQEKLKEIAEVDHTISLQRTLFMQALQTLHSAIINWKRRFVLSAPTTGVVSLLLPLQENQFLDSRKLIGFVVPEKNVLYAELLLSQINFGKIDTAQKVQLRLDAYPYQEFGFVSGRVDYISEFSSDSGYVARVRLPSPLMTNRKREIYYRAGLKGEGRVITKDLRLLQRLYYNVISQFAGN